jgi:hypothetical protein
MQEQVGSPRSPTAICSYLTGDENADNVVSGVANELKARGCSIWWELGDINCQEAFQAQYYRKCLQSEWSIAFVSKSYPLSEWATQEWGVLATNTKRLHVLLDPIHEIQASIKTAVLAGNTFGSKMGMELDNGGSLQFLLGHIPCRDPKIIAEHIYHVFTDTFNKGDACDAASRWSQQQMRSTELSSDVKNQSPKMKMVLMVSAPEEGPDGQLSLSE